MEMEVNVIDGIKSIEGREGERRELCNESKKGRN